MIAFSDLVSSLFYASMISIAETGQSRIAVWTLVSEIYCCEITCACCHWTKNVFPAILAHFPHHIQPLLMTIFWVLWTEDWSNVSHEENELCWLSVVVWSWCWMAGSTEIDLSCLLHHHNTISREQIPNVVANDFRGFDVIEEFLIIKNIWIIMNQLKRSLNIFSNNRKNCLFDQTS